MASVNKDKQGRWRVQFKGTRRHTLRLGRQITPKAAADIKRHIDQITEIFLKIRYGRAPAAEDMKNLERAVKTFSP